MSRYPSPTTQHTGKHKVGVQRKLVSLLRRVQRCSWGCGGSLLGGGTEPVVSLCLMVSPPDPGNPASQNKHGRAANRQLRNKTALRSGIWAKSARPPPPTPPPSLPRAARLAQLGSAQRGAARQPPSRDRHGLPVASAGSELPLPARAPPGLPSTGTPSGRRRVARAGGSGTKLSAREDEAVPSAPEAESESSTAGPGAAPGRGAGLLRRDPGQSAQVGGLLQPYPARPGHAARGLHRVQPPRGGRPRLLQARNQLPW